MACKKKAAVASAARATRFSASKTFQATPLSIGPARAIERVLAGLSFGSYGWAGPWVRRAESSLLDSGRAACFRARYLKRTHRGSARRRHSRHHRIRLTRSGRNPNHGNGRRSRHRQIAARGYRRRRYSHGGAQSTRTRVFAPRRSLRLPRARGPARSMPPRSKPTPRQSGTFWNRRFTSIRLLDPHGSRWSAFDAGQPDRAAAE